MSQLGLESFRVSLRHKKNQTAACDFCKKRKIKCDGKNPCFNCSFRSLDCVYSKQAKRGRRSATAKPDSLLEQLQPRLTIQQEHNNINISLAPPGSPSSTCNHSPPHTVPSPKDSNTDSDPSPSPTSSCPSSGSSPASPLEIECIQRDTTDTTVENLIQQHHFGTVAERMHAVKEFSIYLKGWISEIVEEEEIVSPKNDAQRSQLLAVMAMTTRIKGDLRRAHNYFLQALSLARTVFDEVSDDAALAVLLVGSYFPLHHPKSYIYSSLAATIASQMKPTLRRSRLIKLSILISNMSDRGSTGVHKYASILKHTASKNEQMPEIYDNTLNLLMHIFANLALKFNVFWDINNAILLKKMHFSDGEREELMRRISLGEDLLSNNYKDTSAGMVCLFKIFKVLVLWRGGNAVESTAAAHEALDYCYNNSVELFFATDLTTLMVLVWYFKETCDYPSLYKLEDLIRRLSTLTDQPEYLDYLSPEFAANAADSASAINMPIAHPSSLHSALPLPLSSPFAQGNALMSRSTPAITMHNNRGETTHNYNSIIINSNINVGVPSSQAQHADMAPKVNNDIIMQLQEQIQQLKQQLHSQAQQHQQQHQHQHQQQHHQQQQQQSRSPPSPQAQEVPRHVQQNQQPSSQLQQQQQQQQQQHPPQQQQFGTPQQQLVTANHFAPQASPFTLFQEQFCSSSSPFYMVAGSQRASSSSSSSFSTPISPLQSHYSFMVDGMNSSLETFLSDSFPLSYEMDA